MNVKHVNARVKVKQKEKSTLFLTGNGFILELRPKGT